MKKILLFSFLMQTLSCTEIHNAHVIHTIESQRITNECNLLQVQALERGMNEIIQDGRTPAEAAKKISALIDRENKEFKQCFAKKALEKSESEVASVFIFGGVGFLGGVFIALSMIASK